jgi:ATP-dependent Clp protease ATP-binding subunit ClpX
MYELPELAEFEVIVTKEVVDNGAKPLYIKDKKTA